MTSIGAFTPTIFFHMFGGYVQDCSECALVSETEVRCSGCHYAQTDLRHDALFMDSLKCVIIVFVSRADRSGRSCGSRPCSYRLRT